MGIMCVFGLHNWVRVSVDEMNMGRMSDGRMVTQARVNYECADCGATKGCGSGITRT